jgi:uncharacterized Fe-S cluster-containing radical SAM superfamily protein
MLKPAGSLCNLACKYCYYLEKGNLYKQYKDRVISDELLEKFVKDYIESQTLPQVLFTWHGGETLMRPISFYKKALELETRYAGGRQIDNCIQTNGTLLTDEWCEFFKENNFLVGVSIDGPQEFPVDVDCLTAFSVRSCNYGFALCRYFPQASSGHSSFQNGGYEPAAAYGGRSKECDRRPVEAKQRSTKGGDRLPEQ